jgi:hypothetical protein
VKLEFEVNDRFYEAAEEWADRRMMDTEEALATKVEQSLLEIEHLVSESHDVEFEVDGRTVVYEPTAELATFLRKWAEETGLEERQVLAMQIDLFANAFLDEVVDDERRPGVSAG